MKTKKFDNLGIEPSLLGFGCMRFPLNEDGKINEKEAEKRFYKYKKCTEIYTRLWNNGRSLWQLTVAA